MEANNPSGQSTCKNGEWITDEPYLYDTHLLGATSLLYVSGLHRYTYGSFKEAIEEIEESEAIFTLSQSDR